MLSLSIARSPTSLLVWVEASLGASTGLHFAWNSIRISVCEFQFTKCRLKAFQMPKPFKRIRSHTVHLFRSLCMGHSALVTRLSIPGIPGLSYGLYRIFFRDHSMCLPQSTVCWLIHFRNVNATNCPTAIRRLTFGMELLHWNYFRALSNFGDRKVGLISGPP